MAVIRRNITRVAKNTIEVTNATDTPNGTTVALVLLTSDALYLAYKAPFTTRFFQFGQANTNAATLTVEYWNGSDWAAVKDLIDQTQGMTANGFLSWVNEDDWATKDAAPFADLDLYWIRITTSANFSVGTTLQAVLNLFCDDSLVAALYPEIISDTRFVPEGQSNFLSQYVVAVDMVVTRLKQDEIIQDENQIIDVNQVSLAAAHFAAWAILNPIANDEESRIKAKTALDNGHKLLNKVKFSFDLNDSGIIEAHEEENGNVFLARG